MTTYKREDLRRVTLADLSEQCDESLLHELCAQFGEVRNIVWPTSAAVTLGGVAQRQSYCFVDFASSEDAQYCFEALYRTPLKLHGKELRVRYVGTELAQKEAAAAAAAATAGGYGSVPTAGGRGGASSGLHEVGAKVIVRNIDIKATEYDLTTFFSQYGAFAAPPRMMRDSIGNFRGTAIFSFRDFAASDRLVDRMDQRVYHDRVISVQYAELEDNSGRLHGGPEERASADLVRAEEAKYLAKLAREMAGVQQDQRRERAQNTSWADQVNVYQKR